MNKLFYTLISLLGLASCANTYNIQGSSNVSTLDGRMLYLKVLKDNDFKKLDSCDVVHGQFHFAGAFDSVAMASIFKKWNQLRGEQLELVHRHDQAIMDGSDMNQVIKELNAESVRLSVLEDSLVTTFVTDNFDNVLGPGVFMMVTLGNPYPQLTPWIEDIMSKATTHFKNDAYVKDYYQKAQENEQIMNGMREVPAPAPAQPAQPVQPAPTPNELAQPR